MSDAIRAFIAIPLDLKIQQAIERIQNHLKKTNSEVKWVKPENIHITLKFLGDIDLRQINSVKEVLANLTQNTKRFTIELTRLGAFPNIDRPRTLWVGLKDSKQRLNQFSMSLEKALGKIRFQAYEKSFSPHITIGRIRSSENIKALSRSILEYHVPEGLSQTTSNITLYKSTLNSEGPAYEPLYQIKLKK